MPGMLEFLQQLLGSGAITFREAPALAEKERQKAREFLARAFADFRLDVAGPPLAFDADVALAAAEFVRQACWFLVHRGEPDEEVARRLTLPPPASDAQHLSADLVLRFLPGVQARAQALAPDDPLAVILKEVLRQWPLSGVLAAVTEAPLTPPEFDHPGLRLLYAERLAAHAKPAWRPREPGLEYVRLVYREQGQESAAFLQVQGESGDAP